MSSRLRRGTRAQRQDKLVDPWRLHISWLSGEEDPDRTTWVTTLYETIDNATAGARAKGKHPTKTGDYEAGERRTEQIDALKEYTDFVVALSNKYLGKNIDREGQESSGELSSVLRAWRATMEQAIARGEVDAIDRLSNIRVWLAPLFKAKLGSFKVAGYWLEKDMDENPYPELVRLCDKQDQERFRLPSDRGKAWEDEIDRAVFDHLVRRLEENS